MKKITLLVFSLIASLLLCSCNSSEPTVILFDSNTAGEITDNSKEWVTWKTESIGEDTEDYAHNPVDKDQQVLKAYYEGYIPPDADSSIYLGEMYWDSYSLSFDFFMGESCAVEFSMYSDYDYKASFILWSDGMLSKPPYGSYRESEIKGKDGKCFVPDLQTNVWNHIELKPINSKLVMFFNGKEMGEIYDLGDNPYGQFSLGGTMFKNIVAYC